MNRTGPLRERLALRALRLGTLLWRLGERVGIDVVGATEGPALPDPSRRKAFDEQIAAALAGDGIIDAAACDYPVHELLTHLVNQHGMLLHGSNDATFEVLEPRPARDFGTELHAVVACADGVWPIFYAVIDRDRVDGIFNGCVHVGRPPRLRRSYVFALAGADPAASTSWTRGAVYALPRNGFRREWGTEWVSPEPSRPLLRVLVGPEDFPLRDAAVAASPGDGFRTSGDACERPETPGRLRRRHRGTRRRRPSGACCCAGCRSSCAKASSHSAPSTSACGSGDWPSASPPRRRRPRRSTCSSAGPGGTGSSSGSRSPSWPCNPRSD